MNARAHIHYSNMPFDEEFRINGTLCAASIEELLKIHQESEGLIDNISTATDEIREASACLSEEDVLQKTILKMQGLNKRIRSLDAKSILEEALEELQQHITELQQQSEYGREKLTSAIKLLTLPSE